MNVVVRTKLKNRRGLRVPFILERNLSEGIVSVCKTLLHVPDGRRIALCSLLAFAAGFGFLLFEKLEFLHEADSGKVEDLKSSGQVIIFFPFFIFALGLVQVSICY